jgi:hypothetical protein
MSERVCLQETSDIRCNIYKDRLGYFLVLEIIEIEYFICYLEVTDYNVQSLS